MLLERHQQVALWRLDWVPRPWWVHRFPVSQGSTLHPRDSGSGCRPTLAVSLAPLCRTGHATAGVLQRHLQCTGTERQLASRCLQMPSGFFLVVLICLNLLLFRAAQNFHTRVCVSGGPAHMCHQWHYTHYSKDVAVFLGGRLFFPKFSFILMALSDPYPIISRLTHLCRWIFPDQSWAKIRNPKVGCFSCRRRHLVEASIVALAADER